MASRAVSATRSLLALALILLASKASAQTDIEVNAAVQFDFVSPGARSLALGGAFIGLADDATAAFTNPAGLTILSKPEFSLEGRGSKFYHVFTNTGRLDSEPTNKGIDTIPGLVDGQSTNNRGGISFASFVYPRGPWALSVYRHETSNFKARTQTQGAFLPIRDDFDHRLFPVRATLDVHILNYGLSAARRFGPFSIGAGVSLYTFKMSALAERFQFCEPPKDRQGPCAFYSEFYQEPLPFEPVNQVNSQTQIGEDTAFAFNLGSSWRISNRIRVGAVYRKGPTFKFTAQNIVGPAGATADFPSGSVYTELPDIKFNVPEAFGVGAALRPTEMFTIAVDFQRVRYSRLTKDFKLVFKPIDSEADSGPPPMPEDFVADDNSQLHVGMEYVFAQAKYPIALRLGGWNDPDHKTRFIGPSNVRTDGDRALFQPGKDPFHVSGGLGIIIGKHFHLDAAFDISSRTRSVFGATDQNLAARVKVVSLSGVYRF